VQAFSPPFCPRHTCPENQPHTDRPYSNYIAWGSYDTAAFGTVPRFRCTVCAKTFSTQTFRTDYYAKRVLEYDDIARRLASCESLSAIGRALRISTDSVSNRIARASRQALAFSSCVETGRRPLEDLAADGFESFCVSQYFPNNIHLLVGSQSQFVYAADHVTLRRKGRMTDHQKAKRAKLDLRFRPPKRAIESSFARVAGEGLRVLSDASRPELTLWTDEKQEYPRAIASSPCLRGMAETGRFVHRTVSSRAARTRDNPLFPVNYLDRELRKDLAEHVRESTRFGRNVNRQMERLSLYLYWHNFRKRHRAREEGLTHAQVAGYETGVMDAVDGLVWEERAWLSRTAMTEANRESWLRLRRTPLRKEVDYLPKYAWA
jgi:transposase-like protein